MPPRHRPAWSALLVAGLLVTLAACARHRGAPTPAPAPAAPRVLVILSSAPHLELRDGRRYATGYFLSELLVPLRAIVDAGFEPVFATPTGAAPVADPHSLDAQFFGGSEAELARALAWRDALPGLRAPRRLADVAAAGLDDVVGVFVPGGHAPMADLLVDPALGDLLRQAHATALPTGLICHGPIALLAALPDPHGFTAALAAGTASAPTRGAWPYAGYRVAVFTTAEEQAVETPDFLGGKVRFYPDAALRTAGAVLDVAPPFAAHAVVDRELVTAQQPASDHAFIELFLPALRARAARLTSP